MSRSVPHFLCDVGKAFLWVVNSPPLGRCFWCGFRPSHLMWSIDPDTFNSHVHKFGWDLGLECFLEVCFSSLIGRNQCYPSLLNEMWMLESMNITHSIITESLCYRETTFFIDYLWTLLACIGLVNIEMAQRRSVLPLCSLHLLPTLSSFHPVGWIPHPHPFLLFFFFIFFVFSVIFL